MAINLGALEVQLNAIIGQSNATARFIGDLDKVVTSAKTVDNTLGRSETALADYADRMSRAQAQVSGLTAAQKSSIATAQLLGDSHLETAQRVGIGTDALKLYKDGLKEAEQAAARAAKAVADESAAAQQSAPVHGSLTQQILGMAGGFAVAETAMGLAKSAGTAFISFLGSSIDSYASAEAAQKKLTVALTANGTSTPTVVQQYNDLAAQFQRTTKFSDDLINEMEALLVTVGGAMPSQMDAALTAATDLASGLGIDLKQATMLVAKGMAGETGTFARYGIQISDTALAARGAGAVFDAIHEKFAGQAQGELETYDGKLQNLANSWDNVKEAIGGAIIQSPLLNTALRLVQSTMGDVSDKAGETRLRLSDFIPPDPSGTNRFVALLEDVAEGMNSVAAASARLSRMKPPAMFSGNGGWMPDPSVMAGEVKAAKDAAEAHKKAESAALQHATAIHQLAAEITGGKLVQQARDLSEAWNTLTPRQRENITIVDGLVERYAALRQQISKAGGGLPADLEALYQAHLPVIKGTQQWMDVASQIHTNTLPNLSGRTTEVRNAMAGLTKDGFIPLSNEVGKNERAFNKLSGVMNVPWPVEPVKLMGFHIRGNTQATDAWGASVGSLSEAFAHLDQLHPLEGWVADVAELIAIMNVAQQSGQQLASVLTKTTKNADGSLSTAFDFSQLNGSQGTGNQIAAGAQLFQAGVSGYGAIKQATEGGGAAGAAKGALTGAAIGSNPALLAVTGGWSVVVGAGIGALVGVLRKGSQEVARVADEFGTTISKDLAKQIDKLKASFGGDRFSAEVFSLDKIIGEAGGLKSSNIDQLTHKLHDVFSLLEQGKFSLADAQNTIEANFDTFAAYVTKSTDLASTEFVDLIRLNQQFGTESEKIRTFVEQQTGALGTSITALAAPLVAQYSTLSTEISSTQAAITQMTAAGQTGSEDYAEALAKMTELQGQQAVGAAASAAEIERLGVIALGSFNAAVAGGADYLTAVDKLGPGLDSLIGLQETLGVTTENVALQELQSFRDRVNANRGLVSSVSALGETMRVLASIGGLNVDTLAALEAQGQQTLDRLTSAGFTEQQSLQQMKGFLLNVITAHEQLGTPIDANTAALINQADKYGLLQKDGKSVQDVLGTGFDNLTLGINRLITTLGGVPIAFDKIGAAINNIPKTVPIDFQVDYPELPAGVDLPQFKFGTHGLRNFGAGTMVELHGTEAVVPQAEYDRLLDAVPSAMRTDGGASRVNDLVGGDTITVTIDARGALLGDYASQQNFKRMVNEALVGYVGDQRQVGLGRAA
jgi:hypothetical protein